MNSKNISTVVGTYIELRDKNQQKRIELLQKIDSKLSQIGWLNPNLKDIETLFAVRANFLQAEMFGCRGTFLGEFQALLSFLELKDHFPWTIDKCRKNWNWHVNTGANHTKGWWRACGKPLNPSDDDLIAFRQKGVTASASIKEYHSELWRLVSPTISCGLLASMLRTLSGVFPPDPLFSEKQDGSIPAISALSELQRRRPLGRFIISFDQHYEVNVVELGERLLNSLRRLGQLSLNLELAETLHTSRDTILKMESDKAFFEFLFEHIELSSNVQSFSKDLLTDLLGNRRK